MIKKMTDLLPEEQTWLVKAVVSIIVSDGQVEENQIKFLKIVFRQYLENEPEETLIEIFSLLKTKTIPELEKLRVDDLERVIFILNILTASVFTNGKKLKSEVNQYFKAGKKLGLEVGSLSYRLSLEAERERIKRKLLDVRQDIGDFLKIS
jgi:hypothetical protein